MFKSDSYWVTVHDTKAKVQDLNTLTAGIKIGESIRQSIALCIKLLHNTPCSQNTSDMYCPSEFTCQKFVV